MNITTKNMTFIFLVQLMLSCSPLGKKGALTTIGFEQLEIDMGKLEYKMPEKTEIQFFNTGEHPLVIYSIEAGCGCTEPKWDRKPVKPGQSSSISVTYDSESFGRFRKTITVHYNGADSPKNIIIKGEVSYDEEEYKENRHNAEITG